MPTTNGSSSSGSVPTGDTPEGYLYYGQDIATGEPGQPVRAVVSVDGQGIQSSFPIGLNVRVNSIPSSASVPENYFSTSPFNQLIDSESIRTFNGIGGGVGVSTGTLMSPGIIPSTIEIQVAILDQLKAALGPVAIGVWLTPIRYTGSDKWIGTATWIHATDGTSYYSNLEGYGLVVTSIITNGPYARLAPKMDDVLDIGTLVKIPVKEPVYITRSLDILLEERSNG